LFVHCKGISLDSCEKLAKIVTDVAHEEQLGCSIASWWRGSWYEDPKKRWRARVFQEKTPSLDVNCTFERKVGED
jgi:hypothetical protein